MKLTKFGEKLSITPFSVGDIIHPTELIYLKRETTLVNHPWEDALESPDYDVLPEWPNVNPTGYQRSKAGTEQHFMIISLEEIQDLVYIIARSTRDPYWLVQFLYPSAKVEKI